MKAHKESSKQKPNNIAYFKSTGPQVFTNPSCPPVPMLELQRGAGSAQKPELRERAAAVQGQDLTAGAINRLSYTIDEAA